MNRSSLKSIALAIVCFTGAFEVAPAQATTILQQVKTIFVIAMENHNFTQPTPTSSPQQIFTNPAAPYINSLITTGHSNAAQVSYATKYYNAGVGVHPSEPSYVWAEGGTDFGIHTDNDPTVASANVFTNNHLTRQLNAAGIAWKSYQEDVERAASPTNSTSGSSGAINPYYGTAQYDYGVKHNPMAFYTDTQAQNVYAFTNFLRDLTNNTVGRYNWITPNQFNDQHSALTGGYTYHGTAYTGDQAAIAQGDNFLSLLIPKIMASSAYQDHGLIILWWDETEGTVSVKDTTSCTIPEILISPLAKGNAYASSVELNHSSVIKSVEEIFGLTFLANAIPASETKVSGSGYNDVATVNDLSDMLQGVAGIVVQQFGITLTNGGPAPAFTAVNVGSSATNTFTVTNTGLANLTISNIVVTGANAGDFTTGGITLPAAVAVGGSTTFKLVFAPTAGCARTATLQITNNDVSHNPFTLALTGTGNAMPLITSQPASLTTNAGRNVSFSVSATDCATVSYQWYFETNLLAGKTGNTLSLASVGPTNVGSYHATVTSAGLSTNSSNANLTVTYQTPDVVGGQTLSGNGSFQLAFSGPVGQTYQVLASADVTAPKSTWSVVGSGTFTNTNAFFLAATTNQPGRFYLIKSP